MDYNQLIASSAAAADCSREQAGQVLDAILENMANALASGQTVDLGERFGVFEPRLREAHLAPGSPRTPKDSRYKVVFREGKQLRKRLKVTAQPDSLQKGA